MWSPKTGWGHAKEVLEQNGLSIIEFKPKEVYSNRSILSAAYPKTIFGAFVSGLDNDQWHTVYHCSGRGR